MRSAQSVFALVLIFCGVAVRGEDGEDGNATQETPFYENLVKVTVYAVNVTVDSINDATANNVPTTKEWVYNDYYEPDPDNQTAHPRITERNLYLRVKILSLQVPNDICAPDGESVVHCMPKFRLCVVLDNTVVSTFDACEEIDEGNRFPKTLFNFVANADSCNVTDEATSLSFLPGLQDVKHFLLPTAEKLNMRFFLMVTSRDTDDNDTSEAVKTKEYRVQRFVPGHSWTRSIDPGDEDHNKRGDAIILSYYNTFAFRLYDNDDDKQQNSPFFASLTAFAAYTELEAWDFPNFHTRIMAQNTGEVVVPKATCEFDHPSTSATGNASESSDEPGSTNVEPETSQTSSFNLTIVFDTNTTSAGTPPPTIRPTWPRPASTPEIRPSSDAESTTIATTAPSVLPTARKNISKGDHAAEVERSEPTRN